MIWLEDFSARRGLDGFFFFLSWSSFRAPWHRRMPLLFFDAGLPGSPGFLTGFLAFLTGFQRFSFLFCYAAPPWLRAGAVVSSARWPWLVFQILGSLGFRVSFHVELRHVVSLWKLNTKFIYYHKAGGLSYLTFPKLRQPDHPQKVGSRRGERDDRDRTGLKIWRFVGVLLLEYLLVKNSCQHTHFVTCVWAIGS